MLLKGLPILPALPLSAHAVIQWRRAFDPPRLRTEAMSGPRRHLPLKPLLRAKAALGRSDLAALPAGAASRAVMAARARSGRGPLSRNRVESHSNDRSHRVYESTVRRRCTRYFGVREVGLIRATTRSAARMHGREDGAVLAADGAYHVPGMGPAFWSAVLQRWTQAATRPGCPTTVAGATALGRSLTPVSDQGSLTPA